MQWSSHSGLHKMRIFTKLEGGVCPIETVEGSKMRLHGRNDATSAAYFQAEYRQLLYRNLMLKNGRGPASLEAGATNDAQCITT